ncbi:MAG: hypothetical protein K6F00_10525 [Lachnospiraceae bacterium]|nr:hypothetical protein [Lachnospiraceae bacterium]
MQVNVTVNSEDLLRIENEDDAAITIRKQGNKAQLLSVFVPKYDREEGVGSELLAACENVALSMGMESMTAYYPDSIEGMTEFLENAGYKVNVAAPAIAIDISNILSSFSVKKLLAADTGGSLFAPLSELVNLGGEGLVQIVSKFKINIKNSDVSRFHKEISGVVYDKYNDPKTCIICTKEDDSLVVELFAGIGESNPIYVTAAIQGMLRGIIESGGEEEFKYLSMIVANKKIESCLDRFFKKEIKRENVADIMSASKTLTDTGLLDTDIDEDIDEDKDEVWEREVRKVPLMGNSVFKMSWISSVNSTDGGQEYLKMALEDLYEGDMFFREKITLRELSSLPFINVKPSDNVFSIDDVDSALYKKALLNCELVWAKKRIEKFSEEGLKGLEGRLSCCIASEEDVTGMLLVRRKKTGELVIELIFAKEGCEKTDIPDMIRYFVRAALIRYGKDQSVIFR